MNAFCQGKPEAMANLIRQADGAAGGIGKLGVAERDPAQLVE